MPFSALFRCLPLLAALGCSVSLSSRTDDYDSDLALDTLSAALEAWKDGNVKVLVSLDSPIRFLDDDQLAGFRLVDYELVSPAQSVRPFKDVPVSLTLAKGNGAPITRAAVYQVSLEPDRAVLRSDP